MLCYLSSALFHWQFAAVLADHLHHFSGVVKLFEEAVEFLEGMSAAVGDALLAATVEAGGVLALVRGHRSYHRLDGLEGIVADFHVFGELTHAGNHAEEVFH
jgi:hypothetical protein